MTAADQSKSSVRTEERFIGDVPGCFVLLDPSGRHPTTAVLRNGVLYVVHSKLNQLIASSQDQKSQMREQATIRPIGRISDN